MQSALKSLIGQTVVKISGPLFSDQEAVSFEVASGRSYMIAADEDDPEDAVSLEVWTDFQNNICGTKITNVIKEVKENLSGDTTTTFWFHTESFPNRILKLEFSSTEVEYEHGYAMLYLNDDRFYDD